MTVKDLRKILSRLPDDTYVCQTSGENGCINLESAKYCPQYSILYLEQMWLRGDRTSHIDMVRSARQSGVKYDKFMLKRIRDYAEEGKKIVDEKHDGKKHRVQVILSKWDEYLFGTKMQSRGWLSLVVDDRREDGGKLGVGVQTVVCDFEWESFKQEGAKA